MLAIFERPTEKLRDLFRMFGLTKDDFTVYLDEGARLLGKLELNGCRRIQLCGLGRIDDGGCPVQRLLLDISGCEDVTVRDITLTDSTFWNCRIFGNTATTG